MKTTLVCAPILTLHFPTSTLVFRFLGEAGGQWSALELAVFVGRSSRSVRRALRGLLADGLVRRCFVRDGKAVRWEAVARSA